MQTIFHSNRKHLRRPYFVGVYLQNKVRRRYILCGSPLEREWHELVRPSLYRINIWPHGKPRTVRRDEVMDQHYRWCLGRARQHDDHVRRWRGLKQLYRPDPHPQHDLHVQQRDYFLAVAARELI